jgi:hypothetical protein
VPVPRRIGLKVDALGTVRQLAFLACHGRFFLFGIYAE